MLLEKYTEVNFDVKCLMTNPVTKQWMIFLPDIPHLTKNIATSLELPPSLNSKQDLRYGNISMNKQMIEEIWLECNGASSQLQTTKLTTRHFDKVYSWINVSLATQLLSQSTTEMIHNAILDDTIMLSLCNKGILKKYARRW